MSEGEKAKLRLEIAHVLFIDIVGYSKLRINEQSEQVQRLREIVCGTRDRGENGGGTAGLLAGLEHARHD